MTGALTGAVAGLATVTPAAGFVPPWAAAGHRPAAPRCVCYLAVQFRVRRDWDDALDVWGVHGVGGVLGTILTGVFASAAINGVQRLIEGDTQPVHRAGRWRVAICRSLRFVVTYLGLKFINLFTPVRVADTVEERGLDVGLHGETAYDLPAPTTPVAEEADTVEIKS